MKKIFLMGDSICGHYYPYLRTFLEGQAEIVRRDDLETAYRDLAPYCNSEVDLKILRERYQDRDFQPDLLLLNCGLHDIKTTGAPPRHEVEPEDYEHNLLEMVNLCNQRHTAVIWVRTTPVDDAIHNRGTPPFFRYHADVERYNDIADGIMAKHRIPVLDLYGFTRKLGADGRELYVDHVHYHESIRELQAAFIAGYLNADLQRDK